MELHGINVNEETAKMQNLHVGVYVKSIDDFSAAEKASLKIGDIIIKINNTEIKTMDELNNVKNKCSIGDEITLTIIRDNSEKQIKLTLGEEP